MFLSYVMMTLLMFLGILLIIIILLQKGRGGGLAGAFGGSGGQSALGTKAGDVFTKITVIMAVIWVVLAGVSGIVARTSSGRFEEGSAVVTPDKPTIGANETKSDDPDVNEAPEKPEFNTELEDKKDTTSPTEPAKKTEEKADTAKPKDATEPAEKKQDTPAETEKPKSESKSN